ncbi:MAG: cytochrome c biogenesis CcdA family protein [Oscillospiraceae bacterium]|jgi:cytochrome c-type biogenesis protein|nr:cytochrome c biogenesis CcdA family protein [Oscillospiraceae bacterium]
MDNLLAFLEGIITFISPCLLPLLPVYISFFAGENGEQKPLVNGSGFVLGFTLVFMTMGGLAGSVGMLLNEYSQQVNIVCGSLIALFGLSFCGIIELPTFGLKQSGVFKPGGFFKTMLFGAMFSISWTPCVGAFLGSALMLAASSTSALKGVTMLLCFSLGLGLPFMASALMIDRMKSAFNVIKRHYATVRAVSGGFLVATGLLMSTGVLRDVLNFMQRFAS